MDDNQRLSVEQAKKMLANDNLQIGDLLYILQYFDFAYGGEECQKIIHTTCERLLNHKDVRISNLFWARCVSTDQGQKDKINQKIKELSVLPATT